MPRKRVLVSSFLLLLMLTACHGNPTKTPAVSASPPPAGYVLPPTPAQVNAPLVGDYLTTITPKDGTPVIGAHAVIVPTSVGSLSTGKWVISFRAEDEKEKWRRTYA